MKLDVESKIQQITAIGESIAKEEERHRREKQKMIEQTNEMAAARRERLK